MTAVTVGQENNADIEIYYTAPKWMHQAGGDYGVSGRRARVSRAV